MTKMDEFGDLNGFYRTKMNRPGYLAEKSGQYKFMKNKNSVRLAENLVALMTSRKLSISSTARRAKINKSTLHNLCNGVLPKGLATLAKLSDFFDTNLFDLIYNSNIDNSSPEGDVQKSARETLIHGVYEVTIREINPAKNKKDEG